MRACPSCGFPIDLPTTCPKCDEELVQAKARKPLVIDLALRGETVSLELANLDKAISECLWHGHPSISHGKHPRWRHELLTAAWKNRFPCC